MKERVDSSQVWWESSTPNGPASQDMPGTGPKMDAEVKAEVKDDDGRKSTDSRPPSRKLNNGESGGKAEDITLSIKAEDNNNKRIKLEKKTDRRRRKSFFTGVKSENGKPGSVGSDSQKASPASSTPQLPVSNISSSTSVMCPSQGGTIVTSSEPPFMQQQSEIFVFSTNLANQAADSVRMGHCKTIIQYHMDHPNTKAFLQKHPLKPSNFRQGMPHGPVAPGMKMDAPPTSGMMRMHGPPSGNWGPSGPMEDPSMMGPGGMMPNHPYPPNSAGPRMMGGWGPCGGPHPHPMGPGNYPPGPMMDMENEYMMANAGGAVNISSSQVPDENLTSEQRQHRSKGLAQLTKIHQMLMGSNGSQENRPPMSGPDVRPGGPAGMYPGGPPGGMMTSQQQAMMSQQQAMMSQGGMMPPHGMMSPQQQHHHNMMVQQGMPPYGPRGPGPGMPGMNGKEQYHAQREWFQVQQEYYMEKQQRMQHMRGPHMEPGPPPSYYSSISQKHGNMGGPTSPNMNGMRMPMPPHGPPMGPGMEHEGMMYGGHPDMCRPPHMGMDPMAPGMHGYPPHHGMPPQGPMDPGFDPTMAGAMPPGMNPGAPRHPGPMPPQGHPHMMGHNGMMGPGHAKTPSQVTLHRAGNPEQFNPETMGGVIPPVMPPNSSASSGNSSKPPPSYAQAQKRKRDDIDGYSKGNLQQTPSPTKIQYHLNQFEGQELTITKQLNAAYVAGNGGDDSMCPTGVSGGHFNSHSSSPLHGPGSNKGPMSNSSQTSTHLSSPPVASTAGPSPMTVPPPQSTSSASSGANMRLSHFDPPPLSNGMNNAPHTPNSKSSSSSSSLSNITSASLANLAKGVENLSNQMQQNMMQGGPFHSIQVQGQMNAGGGTGNGNAGNNPPSANANNSNNGSTNVSVASSTTTTAITTSTAPLASPAAAVPSSNASAGTPSVTNTYIATNMSISQVNVPNHPGMNSYVNMQMQNMSSETNIPPGGGPGMNPAMMGQRAPAMTHQMSQSQAMMGPMGGNPGMHPSQGPMPTSGPMMASGGAVPPHGPNPNMPPTPPVSKGSQFTSPPLSHPQMSGSHAPQSGVTSPQFPPSSSNSSVQIQQKGHNTIQYLPANPPTSSQAPPGKPQTRPEIDYSGMPRFPSPHPVMDGKNQVPSTLQYFPNSSPTGPRPPISNSLSATMGPEFANQATIAMHQSAAMRSPSLPDIPGSAAPAQPPTMGPMDAHGHPPNSMSGPTPMMGSGPDPMMGMGPGGVPMRPGHSPGAMRSMPQVMGSGSLECVSPIPGMGGYMNNGPSIEQAQAQAQAHAAMMMQGNAHMPGSSPHGPNMTPGGPSGGPSPHMPSHTPMSMHGPTMPGMPGSSPHGMSMPGQSPHVPAMSSVSSPHGTTMPPGPSPHGPPMAPGPSPHGPPMAPGPSPHGPMAPVASPHGHMGGMSPHNAMPGAMPPHGPMGPMHGPSMPRHPGMGVMRMPGPGMGGMPPGNPGQYGNMQYPQYQHDFYHPQSRGPRQMVPGMMSGPPGQPYGMMPNMPSHS